VLDSEIDRLIVQHSAVLREQQQALDNLPLGRACLEALLQVSVVYRDF